MINLADYLELARPLAVLDLETTGKTPGTDRIIQVGLTMHYPDKPPVAWKTYVDPQMAIPPEATHKNKISDADVTGAPTWHQVGPALAPRITSVDFVAYNGDFDLQHTRAEMRRVGVDWCWERNGSRLVDPKAIFFIKHPRDLDACWHEYGGEGGERLPADASFDAHDAGNDVLATEQSLRGQLLRHSDLPRTVAALSDFCFPQREGGVDRAGKLVWRNGEAAVSFGKHAGKTLREMCADAAGRQSGRSYLEWMAGPKSDFPGDVKDILQRALAGEFPRR